MRPDANQLKKFWTTEVPTGVINGTNKIFSISTDPIEADAVLVFKNGLKLLKTEYTLSGTTITLIEVPQIGSSIEIWFIKRSGE